MAAGDEAVNKGEQVMSDATGLNISGLILAGGRGTRMGHVDKGLVLLRGIPIMIAADMTKAMVTGGGSLPGYMAYCHMALPEYSLHEGGSSLENGTKL